MSISFDLYQRICAEVKTRLSGWTSSIEEQSTAHALEQTLDGTDGDFVVRFQSKEQKKAFQKGFGGLSSPIAKSGPDMLAFSFSDIKDGGLDFKIKLLNAVSALQKEFPLSVQANAAATVATQEDNTEALRVKVITGSIFRTPNPCPTEGEVTSHLRSGVPVIFLDKSNSLVFKQAFRNGKVRMGEVPEIEGINRGELKDKLSTLAEHQLTDDEQDKIVGAIKRMIHSQLQSEQSVFSAPQIAAAQASSSQIEVPQDFICPISFEIMTDPVVINQTEQVCDRESATQAFTAKPMICPLTNTPLTSQAVTRNNYLRGQIEKFKTEHPEAVERFNQGDTSSPSP